MKQPLLIGICLAALLLAAGAGRAQDDQPKQSDAASTEDEHLAAILSAQDTYPVVEGFAKLFESATLDGVRRLQRHSSDTIAIQAAWHEIELTLPDYDEEQERVQSFRVDQSKLSRFIGFLEGRARVQAPDWWTDSILNARAYGRSNVVADWSVLREEPTTVRFTKDKDDVPVLSLDSDSVFVPVAADLQDQLGGRSFAPMAALDTDSSCYVAAYDDVGFPYKLACVERPAGRTRWIADVWGCWWGGASGVHLQKVEIVEQGDRVGVFGVSYTGFHAEMFRAEDGANLVRFSNNYSAQ